MAEERAPSDYSAPLYLKDGSFISVRLRRSAARRLVFLAGFSPSSVANLLNSPVRVLSRPNNCCDPRTSAFIRGKVFGPTVSSPPGISLPNTKGLKIWYPGSRVLSHSPRSHCCSSGAAADHPAAAAAAQHQRLRPEARLLPLRKELPQSITL